MSTPRPFFAAGFFVALALALPRPAGAQILYGVSPTNPTMPVGNSVTFTADFEDGTLALGSSPPVSYQWSLNGTAIPGATATSYTTPPIDLTSQGVYTVAVTNAAGAVSFAGSSLTASFLHEPTFAFGSWSAAQPLPDGTSYSAIAFDGSFFLAVGLDGTAYSSSDGIAWSPSLSNGLGQSWGELNGIVAVPGTKTYVAVGNGGAIVTYTDIAFAGQLVSSGTTNLLTGIAAGNGTLAAVGYGGVGLYSTNGGQTWTAAATGVTQNLNAIAYGNGRFVAVGLGGTVANSPDGVKWTVQPLGASTNLYGVTYGARGFVAVGDNGAIFDSPDGALWLSADSTISSILVHVGYGAGVFVAVGLDGTVVTSTDEGYTWTPQNSGTPQRLDGVTYGINSFVLTGGAGTVVRSAAAVPSELGNLSARAFVGTGSDILIAGFVTKGDAGKEILARGIGPALDQFDLTGLPAVDLALQDAGGNLVDSNSGWGDSAALMSVFAKVGAFALTPNSGDAALELGVNPGPYTAQVSGSGGATGVALAEIYDADGSLTAKLVNLSARANVGTGGNILIAGFVIAGNTPQTVLLRGVGPSLSQYGISSPLATPQLVLFDANNNALLSNTVWGGGSTLAQTFTKVGAFSLAADSADSAILVTLPPGNYTAELSGVSGATGIGLAEVYDVPN